MKFFKSSNDSMFKSIFCDEKNRDLLKRLIEEVIEEKVEIISLLVPEQIKDNINIKGKSLDVIVKTKDGEINVEVNTGWYEGLSRRNFAYICTRYSDGIDVGESYNKMKNYIQINLTCTKNINIPLKSCYRVCDIENDINYVDNFTIYEINLTKAKKLWYNKTGEISLVSMLDLNETELKKVKGDVLVEKLKSEINRLNGDKDFVEFLSKEVEERLLMNTLIENNYNDGLKQGVEQGANEQKIEIAKKMLKKDIDIDIISEVTGLSIIEIEKLNG